jgi:hypothetical protein
MSAFDPTSSEQGALLPAPVLRDRLCAESRLSKRAALLLRRECDAFAAQLLKRAFDNRAAIGGPLNSLDLWEVLLADGSHGWLVDRLDLWTSPFPGGGDSSLQVPAEVALPLPPEGLTPDSDLLPRLLWRRAPPSADAIRAAGGRTPNPIAAPMHPAFLQDRLPPPPGVSADPEDGAEPNTSCSGRAATTTSEHAEVLHPALFVRGGWMP